jgi:predicted nucleic-acid-binding protein
MFIDTNYFLRYLLNDIPQQHIKVIELFEEASEGDIKLLTSSLVLFEISWVLRSVYQLNKDQLLVALQSILKLSFIRMDERDIFFQALDLFDKTNLSLEDCYNIFYAREAGVKEFKTFDKKLEKEFNK